MAAVILVIHVLIAIALVVLVLLQRSEGGALGIGGGGGGGGFMSGRGTASLLTRATTVLAVAFFTTSIVLTILARNSRTPTSILDSRAPTQQGTTPANPGARPVLPVLPESPAPTTPQVPQSK